jgi:hypothetical protein
MAEERWVQATLDGDVFSASNQAVCSTTAALATAFTGLALGNPATSRYDAVILQMSWGQVAVAVAGAMGVMGGLGVGDLAAAITPVNRRIGGRTSGMLVDDAATIPTPTLLQVFGSIGSLATTGYGLVNRSVAELDGSLIVTPGNFIAFYTTAATTNALIMSFLWQEYRRS